MLRLCWFLAISLFLTSAHLLAQRLQHQDFSAQQIASLTKRAGNGDVKSQTRLGVAYQYGEGVKADLEKAQLWLTKAAGFGDPTAQLQLGLLYLKPELIGTHPGEAMLWFLRAAGSGCVEAELNIALMYFSGHGVAANKAESERWARKAASHGDTAASTMLALMLLDSDNRTAQGEGFQLLKSLAERNVPEAQNSIGVCFEFGKGTEKDLVKASRWYLRASEAGDLFAMNNLANAYYFGNGIPRDVGKAIQWFTRSCEAGSAQSCGALAQLHAKGEGKLGDLRLAYAYARIAGRSSIIADLDPILADGEKASAIALADSWRQQHPLSSLLLYGYVWQNPAGE